MKLLRIAFIAGLTGVTGTFAAGCGPGGGGGGSGGAPGTGGASSTGGQSASGGASSTGGASASGGASSSGGAPGSGGSATGGRGSGGSGSGGNASGGSGSGGSGSGGTSGSGGSGSGGRGSGGSGSGGSGPTTPHGSAAKFICPAGGNYGSPLQGMGSVQQIAAPSGDYFAFIEGPLWIGGTINAVFFSDNASSPQERMFKVVPPSTTAMQFMNMSGSNGLAVDNNDKIIVADQRNRRITRVDPSTGMMLGVVATTSAKPNDVLVRSDDNVYFTDPDTGFYRISPTGTVSAAMNVMQGSRPNGIELSPDENTLYIGDVGNKSITKFTVSADGTIMMGTAAPFATTMNGTTDGMCVDCAGNVYASTANGVEVYSPTGTYIGTVPTGEASNCTFGGPDRKTMYVTSRSVLKYVTLAVPGLPD